MAGLVLDGKAYAKELEVELFSRVQRLKEKTGPKEADSGPPILATILVGADPASATYVRMKGNACRRVGMESLSIALPEETTTQQLLTAIDDLNANPRVRAPHPRFLRAEPARHTPAMGTTPATHKANADDVKSYTGAATNLSHID